MKKMIDIGNRITTSGQVSAPPPNPYQFQNMPFWLSTMADRFMVPASRITLMMIRPSETS